MTHLGNLLLALLLFQIATMSSASRAQGDSYDIDCKIILCLPAGFPSGCADALETFIDRITSVPPKPPIGFCAMGSPRDMEMHDTHPERLDVMFGVIDEATMERTLRSVKVEYHHSQRTCCRGAECDEEYPCTHTWYIDGDGGNFHGRTLEGHHTGSKVFYTDLQGKACIAGNSRSWVPPREECHSWGRDEETVCVPVTPGYWRSNATCALD